MQAELMPLCGNQEVQVQMTVALDPLDEASKQCERVARASYQAGVKALKPGMTFAELVAVMEEPLKVSGCWGYTPLVHSLGPHFLAGRTEVNRDQLELNVRYAGSNAARARQAVLQPGMIFAFEPNACLGNHRVNIGGTVVVTPTGCEELNQIPTEVTHKQ
jgi:Xaa-Pro aminopeptidase